jgi:senataxin
MLNGFSKTMLTEQYRMHPDIRRFPSNQYYGGKISEGFSEQVMSPELESVAQVVGRSIFFDLVDSSETVLDSSK